jgi:hypothetical protein
MAAEGFWVIDWSIVRLEGAKPPRRPTHPSIVMPGAQGVHGEGLACGRHPRFPQARGAPGCGPHSELGNQLGPDRNHPDKQRYRRQRR